MAIEKTNEGRRQQMLRQDEVPSGGGTQGSSDADSGPPQPDMMLGLWMPWMERYFGAARDWINSDKPWWQVTPYDLMDNMLAGGVKQFNDIIAKDPLLGSIDQMWNANPLRKVVPIDWAEITRARAHRLAALPAKAREGHGLGRGPVHDALALHHGRLERGGPALVGHGRH